MSDIFDQKSPLFWMAISIILLFPGLLGTIVGVFEWDLGFIILGIVSLYLFFRTRRIYLQKKKEEDDPLSKL